MLRRKYSIRLHHKHMDRLKVSGYRSNCLQRQSVGDGLEGIFSHPSMMSATLNGKIWQMFKQRGFWC